MQNLWALPLVAVLLGGIVGGLAYVAPKLRLSAELSRKIGHVLMGLICLTFPWLFTHAWPVIMLGLSSILAFSLIRSRSVSLKTVFHRVARESYGEFCFPLAVAILYTIQADPIVDYVIPLLILTLADAAGALFGIRFGKSMYSTDEGTKSWEGSLAFFSVAFLSALAPLLIWTSIGRIEILIISMLVGLIIMLVEAIAWRGLDNLFIPLGTYLLLSIYTQLTAPELLVRLIVLLALVAIFWSIRLRTFSKDGTILASALCLYAIWAVGGLAWVAAPLALLAGYCFLCPRELRKEQLSHKLADLGAVVGVGAFWLFASVVHDKREFFWPFAFSWAAELAIISCAYFSWRQPRTRMVGAVVKANAICFGVFTIPLALSTDILSTIKMIPLLLISVAAASSLYWRIEQAHFKSTNAPGRAWRQLSYGSLASLFGLFSPWIV